MVEVSHNGLTLSSVHHREGWTCQLCDKAKTKMQVSHRWKLDGGVTRQWQCWIGYHYSKSGICGDCFMEWIKNTAEACSMIIENFADKKDAIGYGGCLPWASP